MGSIKNWLRATFLLTFLVIIAGGIVRTTQSGMGCPDWPRCFGKWIPPTNASELPPDFEKYLKRQDIDHSFNAFHTWIEYLNRLSGALLGLFAIIQCVLLFKKRLKYKKAFLFSTAFLGAVILTGIFGAMVVKLNLAHASISVHLLFAIILLEIQLAVLLSFDSKLSGITVEPAVRRLLLGFFILLLVQAVLGTTVRIYVDDVSKIVHYEQRETWLAANPASFLIHRSFSVLVLAGAIFISWYCKNLPLVRNKVFGLALIILLSMCTGIYLFYAGMPAIAQPLHLLLACCAITQVMSVLLQTRSRSRIGVI